MVTVCQPNAGYDYHAYGHNYCKEVAQETCYNVPVFTVVEPTVDVIYPESIKTCVNKPIDVFRISCEDLAEEKCITVPELVLRHRAGGEVYQTADLLRLPGHWANLARAGRHRGLEGNFYFGGGKFEQTEILRCKQQQFQRTKFLTCKNSWVGWVLCFLNGKVEKWKSGKGERWEETRQSGSGGSGIKWGGSGQRGIAFRDLAATRCVVYSQNISKLENSYISTVKKNTNISCKRNVFLVLDGYMIRWNSTYFHHSTGEFELWWVWSREIYRDKPGSFRI